MDHLRYQYPSWACSSCVLPSALDSSIRPALNHYYQSAGLALSCVIVFDSYTEHEEAVYYYSRH